MLTIHEHFELFVVELGLLLRHQGALGALPHGVHEAHAGQRHFLTAALVTETLPTPSAVMLQARENTSFTYLLRKLRGYYKFLRCETCKLRDR